MIMMINTRTQETTATLSFFRTFGATGRIDTIEFATGDELARYIESEQGMGEWIYVTMARADAERLGLFQHELGFLAIPAPAAVWGCVSIQHLN